MEKLNLFFSKIKELTFWQRLFSWRAVRNLSYDAFEEFKSLQKELFQKDQGFDLLDKKLLQAETRNESIPLSWIGEKVFIKFLPSHPVEFEFYEKVAVPDSLLDESSGLWDTLPIR